MADARRRKPLMSLVPFLRPPQRRKPPRLPQRTVPRSLSKQSLPRRRARRLLQACDRAACYSFRKRGYPDFSVFAVSQTDRRTNFDQCVLSPDKT